MENKVNMFRLLIIIMLLCFGGVIMYYQHTLKNLNNNFEQINNNLAICKQNLSQVTTTLTTTTITLNDTIEALRQYDTLYEQQYQQLEAEKMNCTSIEAELTKTILLKETYKYTVDQYYRRVTCLKVTPDNQENMCDNIN